MERCLHPRVYGGKIFPCGKCPACLSVRREELAQRLYIESLVSRCSYFVTLTYDDSELPFAEYDFNCFDKVGVQTFIRSLRDTYRDCGIKLRYFLTCEYGDLSNRSHYHLLLYLDSFLSLQQVYEDVKRKWGKGNVYISSIGLGAAKYCAKYCLKDDGTDELPRGDPNKPFRLFSRRPGLGATPDCVRYYRDNWKLQEKYIRFDHGIVVDGENIIDKIPRVIRNKFPKKVQDRLSRVGWAKFFDYLPELQKSLEDPHLNYFDGSEFIPIFKKDLEIKEKARKLRKLKKNAL